MSTTVVIHHRPYRQRRQQNRPSQMFLSFCRLFHRRCLIRPKQKFGRLSPGSFFVGTFSPSNNTNDNDEKARSMKVSFPHKTVVFALKTNTAMLIVVPVVAITTTLDSDMTNNDNVGMNQTWPYTSSRSDTEQRPWIFEPKQLFR